MRGRCRSDYLPATLTSKDYPNLIAEGEKVDTIAVPAVARGLQLGAPTPTAIASWPSLWTPSSRSFRRSRTPPFHPKWKEVSLSAPLPDWQRLPVAEQWLKSHNVDGRVAREIRGIPETEPGDRGKRQDGRGPESLFKQFQAWEAERGARAQAPQPAQR